MKNPGTSLRSLLLLALLSGCGGSLGISYPDGVTEDLITLTAVQDSLVVTTRDHTTLDVDYTFNRSRQEFEAYQGAIEGITYHISAMKFCGSHNFDWDRSFDGLAASESGTFKYDFANDFTTGSNQLNAKSFGNGRGRVGVVVIASYTDKEGQKHQGAVSNFLIVPAVFYR